MPHDHPISTTTIHITTPLTTTIHGRAGEGNLWTINFTVRTQKLGHGGKGGVSRARESAVGGEAADDRGG